MKAKWLFFSVIFFMLGCTSIKNITPQKHALVIQNFRFAPLGMLEQELVKRGYQISVFDAEHRGMQLAHMNPLDYDLVVVLGGLMSANDTESYPYLEEEMRFLKTRDLHQKPSIGICLGAQLMARSLGGSVRVGENGREFGVKELFLSDHGKKTPFKLLKNFPVVEAHNDTFDIPQGALLLASSKQYKNQAFLHNKSLALQFHPEADAHTVQIWMDIFQRNDNTEMKSKFGYLNEKLRPQIQKFWHSWLDMLEKNEPSLAANF